MSRRIEGRGTKPARLLFIGEAPAKHEEAKGLPFVGPAGWELDKWLKDAKIPEGEYWIDNVSPYRLPGDSVANLNVSEWIPRLNEVIAEVDPRVIVPLGGTSLRAVTGLTSIGNWRGSMIRREDGRRVVPTYHPAYIIDYKNAAWWWRWICIQDFRKAWRESIKPSKPRERMFITGPQMHEIEVAFERLSKGDHITLDIERWKGQVTCVALTNDPSWAISIPFIWAGEAYWDEINELRLWRQISQLLHDKPCWGQNLNFDLVNLRRYGIFAFPEWDSMLMHSCLWLEFPHDLALLTSIYTNEPYYKDEGKDFTPTRQLWEYNCKDAAITDEVIIEERVELRERGLEEFYALHYREKQVYAIEMQIRGVPVDDQEKSDQIAFIDPTLDRVEALIKGYAGDHFNSGSPKQCAEFLYNELGMPPKYHGRTKQVTTNEEALEELMLSNPHPALELLIRAQGLRKALGYLNAKRDADERLRSNFNLSGTETGRWSCTMGVLTTLIDGKITKTGASLHTFPRPMCIHYPMCKGECDNPLILRRVISADQGCVLIGADQRQAEAIIVAAMAEDDLMFEWAMAGTIHFRTCGLLYGVPWESVKKGDDNYEMSKRCVHGANYDMGKRKLARLTGKTESYGASMMEKYHSLFPGIRKRYHTYVRDQVSTYRKLINPLGRERIFMNRMNPDLYREAYAQIPQSTISDITKLVIPKIWKTPSVQNGPWDLVRAVAESVVWTPIEHHDAIFVMCPDTPDSIVETVESIEKAFESIPITISGRTFTIPIDIKIGKSWGVLEKLGATNVKEGERLA